MAENSAPKKNPDGPQAPKIEKIMALLSPMPKVLPIRAIAFGTSNAGPMP